MNWPSPVDHLEADDFVGWRSRVLDARELRAADRREMTPKRFATPHAAQQQVAGVDLRFSSCRIRWNFDSRTTWRGLFVFVADEALPASRRWLCESRLR